MMSSSFALSMIRRRRTRYCWGALSIDIWLGPREERVPLSRRISNGRLMFLAGFAIVSAVLGYVVLTSETDAQDPAYLVNFDLVASQAEQRAALEALLPGRPVSVPEVRIPGPEEKPRRSGPYLVLPEGWSGPVEESEPVDDPPPLPTEDSRVTDLATLQRSDLWRDVSNLPARYEFVGAGSTALGYDLVLTYREPNTGGRPGILGEVEVAIRRPHELPIKVSVVGPPEWTRETDVAGLPGLIWEGHKPDGQVYGTDVRAFDAASGIEYFVRGVGVSTTETLTILRSLISE